MINLRKIKKELSNLPKGFTVILETRSEKALEANLAVMKLLINKNYTVIILSAIRPYSNLMNLYKNNKINTKKILVIDCVSKSKSSSSKERDNVLYVGSASDLMRISISISEAIRLTKDKKFIFIDSISSLIIHNNPIILGRFMHSIITLIREKEINGILFSLKTGINKEIRTDIIMLCDKVIKI